MKMANDAKGSRAPGDKRVYDNYEISGCRHCGEDAKDDRQSVETCGDAEAQFWTLYGHINGQGVEAIGDFSSREAAEEVYYRITGQPFAGSYQADERLRLMRAAPQLLEALQRLAYDAGGNQDNPLIRHKTLESIETANAAIAQASSQHEAPTLPSPDATGITDAQIEKALADRHEIAITWSTVDVRGLRGHLDEEQAWEVLQQVKDGHDADWGISYTTLATVADDMFPKPRQSPSPADLTERNDAAQQQQTQTHGVSL